MTLLNGALLQKRAFGTYRHPKRKAERMVSIVSQKAHTTPFVLCPANSPRLSGRAAPRGARDWPLATMLMRIRETWHALEPISSSRSWSAYPDY